MSKQGSSPSFPFVGDLICYRDFSFLTIFVIWNLASNYENFSMTSDALCIFRNNMFVFYLFH